METTSLATLLAPAVASRAGLSRLTMRNKKFTLT